MSEDIAQAHDSIKLHAAAYAEATVYSMNNNYLTKFQKALVEGIYQTPIGIFNYALLGYLAFVEPFGYLHAFLIAAVFNIVVAFLVWFAANPTIAKLGFICAGTAATIIDLILSGYLAYKGDWIGFGLGVACAFGILSLVTPSLHLYAMLSSKLNPKYQIAKKLFGTRFPFEDHLTP